MLHVRMSWNVAAAVVVCVMMAASVQQTMANTQQQQQQQQQQQKEECELPQEQEDCPFDPSLLLQVTCDVMCDV